MIEIKLNYKLGTCESITLTSINSRNIYEHNNTYVNELIDKNGLPNFALDSWLQKNSLDRFMDNFIDEFELNLKLIIGQNFVSIILDEKLTPYRAIKNKNIIFCIDIYGFLTSVDIINIKQAELEIIRSSIC